MDSGWGVGLITVDGVMLTGSKAKADCSNKKVAMTTIAIALNKG
jgi:hypothetical protein